MYVHVNTIFFVLVFLSLQTPAPYLVPRPSCVFEPRKGYLGCTNPM